MRWTDLEILHNFPSGLNKKGARGKAEMSIFAFFCAQRRQHRPPLRGGRLRLSAGKAPMRQAQNGKHTSCASASTSGQLHQAKDCSKCAQRARTASAAAANSGTQGREVRREASSGPALGAKCRGCRPRLQEIVLKILLSPLEKGFKTRIFFACGAHF